MLINHIDQFIHHLLSSHAYSHNTILAYKNDLMQFARFSSAFVADRNLDLVTIKGFIEELHSKGYATSTVARKVAALKSFVGFLQITHVTNADLGAKIDSPKVQRAPKHLLSDEQIDLLLNSTDQNTSPKQLRNRALLYLLYLTPIHLTDLVELQVEDYTTGKLRDTDLPPKVEQSLRDYLENGRPNMKHIEHENALFLNHRGGQLTRQGIWLIIKECAEIAQLGISVTPRLLRRSFDTQRQP